MWHSDHALRFALHVESSTCTEHLVMEWKGGGLEKSTSLVQSSGPGVGETLIDADCVPYVYHLSVTLALFLLLQIIARVTCSYKNSKLAPPLTLLTEATTWNNLPIILSGLQCLSLPNCKMKRGEPSNACFLPLQFSSSVCICWKLFLSHSVSLSKKKVAKIKRELES